MYCCVVLGQDSHMWYQHYYGIGEGNFERKLHGRLNHGVITYAFNWKRLFGAETTCFTEQLYHMFAPQTSHPPSYSGRGNKY